MELFDKLQNILNRKNTIIIITIMLILTIISTEIVFTKEITIKDQQKQIIIQTLSSNVDNVLKKADIALGEHDQISLDKETKLKDGMVIEVKRAFEIKIDVDGKSIDALTANNKVEDVLKEYDIKLDENDRTQPALNQEIHPKDILHVIRVDEKVVKEAEDIPYRSVITYNDEMQAGTINKKVDGENGKKEVEYRIVYENGVETVKEVVNEEIIKEPVDELIEEGSEKYFVASRGQPVRFKKILTMSATAYDLSFESCGKKPGHPQYGITRSGTKARPGVVAVDPKVIPLGSKLYVKYLDGSKDYGFASAEDTGGAIKGNKIDLFIEDPKTVAKFGRKKVMVYVLD